MLWTLFRVALVAAGTIIAGLVVSVLAPDYRFWPPGERSWAYWLNWLLVAVFDLCMLGVSYLDWGSLGLPRPASLVVGAVTFGVGFAVAILAGRDLGGEETTGLAGDLHTDGCYRYSRNPQYVGYIVATVGWVLLADSRLVAVLGATFVVWQALLPFAEEPWLREQYGDAYEEYRREVPRFVGPTTVARLLS
ncbi:methyltransferase family protein [Halobacteriaceae archaeon GCM10025711]